MFLFVPECCFSQVLTTPFERSRGKNCATYEECISFYKILDSLSADLWMEEAGPTDAGIPLHVVYYQQGGRSAKLQGNTLKILINNSIHPGEPDGTDACMMLLRDILTKKISIPANVRLAVIPVYNIGGALNRNHFSRVNQQGPQAYGFRGNAQNLDLNRDFIKNDSREAKAFIRLFQQFKPAIFIDNHVSDGADYQHTMTLMSTQYDKLGGQTGRLMRQTLDPAIYKEMEGKGWPLIPYVAWEQGNPRNGWSAFYDPPRYSSGYAALFHTIAYVPETHMLKPFSERVKSTYDLMSAIIGQTAKKTEEILSAQISDAQHMQEKVTLPLRWIADTTKPTYYTFLGYQPGTKTSAVTGLPRLFYDHKKPFTARVPIYDHYLPDQMVAIPRAYLIPQGWHRVIDLLELQDIKFTPLLRDTFITVSAYHIQDYKTLPKAYESHYKHFAVTVRRQQEKVKFRKGDLLINTAQPGRRFLIETLEPTGDDSYFAWNFFDAILQQKEGYSDYRWEDIAAEWLTRKPELQKALETKKEVDTSFAKDAAAQLRFVYEHSPYYEPEHLRYPVFRID